MAAELTAEDGSNVLVQDMYHTFLDAKISVQLFFFLVLCLGGCRIACLFCFCMVACILTCPR